MIRRNILSSVVGWNILSTLLRLGVKSGAPLNKPDIVLFANDSDSSANAIIPLVSFLKPWTISTHDNE